MVRLDYQLHIFKYFFYVLTIEQVIENVSSYCLHHQALTSQEVQIILEGWAKYESNTIFVNRLILIPS